MMDLKNKKIQYDVPTAEEFLVNEYECSIDQIQAEGNHVAFCMKEFAKLHVIAALRAAALNANFTDECFNSLQEGTSLEIDQDTILGAYPEQNVK